MDAFVVLRAADPNYVLRWRVEAEAAMAASGRPALDHDAITDYVRRFLPAYALYAGTPHPALPPDRLLTRVLDAQRRVIQSNG